MAQQPESSTSPNLLEAIGLTRILRTVSMALQPAKLALALAAVLLTLAWGSLLDVAWSGQTNLDEFTVSAFIAARQLNVPFAEPEGEWGVFKVFRTHQRRALTGAVGMSDPVGSMASGAAGRFIDPTASVRPFYSLEAMGLGVLWMVKYHPFFFVLFAAGSLAIWSLLGGAICRIAALHFTRDEKPTLQQGLQFAKKRWFGGFFLAPCIPLVFVGLILLVMALGGLLLRIPLIGDILGGLLFFLAILGGFFAAVLLIGLLVGGSLFWPAVAIEGSDAFDSFSRALSYPLTRPLKAIVYAILLIVVGCVCWFLARLFTFWSLGIARSAVGFGTSPFGWFSRGEGETPVRKLDLLWPMGGPNVLWSAPDWGSLSWYECVSAGLIGLYVLLVVALLWAFLFSFYFCGSTVAYCLLRRDVDLIELDEVYADEDDPGTPDRPAAAPALAGSDSGETSAGPPAQ